MNTTVIIACSMIEDEIKAAMDRAKCTWPIVYLERGLHSSPEKLKAKLQEEIDKQSAGTIVLAYCLCGNAIEGVSSSRARLVIPRFHDCIQMCLSFESDKRAIPDAGTYYQTRGWMQGEREIGFEYLRAKEKYGAEKARSIYRQIFSNYKFVALLDTGAYPVEECREKAQRLADEFDLEFMQCPGTTRVLEKLFSANWDGEFCVLMPGEKANVQMFM